MRNSVSSLALLAALTISSTAYAQDMMTPPKGLYLGGGLWASMPEDSNVDGGSIHSDADLDRSFGLMGAVGYAFPNNLRSELEIGWRENDVDGISGATAPSGDVTTWHGMINLMYDVPGMGRWTPYVGGGIGLANISADAGATFAAPNGRVTLDDNDWAFAYQGIAGLGYQVTNNLGVFADYRYFATADAELRSSQNINTDVDYTEHRVMVGLRWFFGAPEKRAEPIPAAAPAPAPAPMVQAPPPAPAPARNYIVFFDFDKADLKPDAQTVVRQAAQNFPRSQGVTRIEATGHAEAVRAELIKQGIPANQISITAKGEAEPLVQTADGVREPQNRRVEIVLR